MINDIYTDLEKETISKSIKNISLETVDREMDKLIKIGTNINSFVIIEYLKYSIF